MRDMSLDMGGTYPASFVSMDARQQLLALADAYAAARKISRARVSTLAVNHGGFLKKVAEGGDFTFGSFDRCVAWFSANWPDDVSWPDDIPRPRSVGAPDGEAA